MHVSSQEISALGKKKKIRGAQRPNIKHNTQPVSTMSIMMIYHQPRVVLQKEKSYCQEHM